jgi:hypothetical protein
MSVTVLTKRDKNLLEKEGWEIITEQKPLYIREKCTGAIATGIAAAMVISYLGKNHKLLLGLKILRGLETLKVTDIQAIIPKTKRKSPQKD